MKHIVFMSLVKIIDVEQGGIYHDLLKELSSNYIITIINPIERRYELTEEFYTKAGVNYLNVRITNITKTNLIEKGFTTVSFQQQILRKIKKHFNNVNVDLFMFSTPPVTYNGVIKYFKTKGAKTYLLLKDIFPQNALDLNYISKLNPLYLYFRMKERNLYRLSDRIGTMSPANSDYLIKHNKNIHKSNVEVFPNSVFVSPDLVEVDKGKICDKYGIPQGMKLFVYGGNLGVPQDPTTILEFFKSVDSTDGCFGIIVGDGTQANYIKENVQNLQNVLYLKAMPRDEYEDFLSIANYGLVFLDSRFTIPNYPSRILSYLQKHIPLVCVVDKTTDLRILVEEKNIGVYLSSGRKDYKDDIKSIIQMTNYQVMRRNSIDTLKQCFDVKKHVVKIHNFLGDDFNV